MSDEMIVEFCSPTLAGIKTGNLFSCEYLDYQTLEKDLRRVNSILLHKKWLWGAIGLQLGTGYTVGFLVYQIGTLITTGALGAGFVGGLIFEIVFAAILIGIIYHNNKAVAVEYKLA